MKFDFTSDLHLDFYVKPDKSNTKRLNLFLEKILPAECSETLILAGDTGHYNIQNIELLKILKRIYKNIVIVTGNHDMYLVSKSARDTFDFNYKERLKDFKRRVEDMGVYLLDGNTINIGGKKIAGIASWYYVSKDDYQMWLHTMNDPILIQDNPGNKKYHGKISDMYGDTFRTTFDTNAYYNEELEKIKGIKECDIFASHVCPIRIPMHYMDVKFKFSNTNVFYHSGLEIEKEFNRINPKVAVFGHVHSAYCFKNNNTDMLCSPIGYPGETSNKIRSFEI